MKRSDERNKKKVMENGKWKTENERNLYFRH